MSTLTEALKTRFSRAVVHFCSDALETPELGLKIVRFMGLPPPKFCIHGGGGVRVTPDGVQAVTESPDYIRQLEGARMVARHVGRTGPTSDDSLSL